MKEIEDFFGDGKRANGDPGNRKIRFQYYSDQDLAGQARDLRSATSPAVIGTSIGNDFPNGKTVTYKYLVNQADSRLNHNLAEITDGRRNDPDDPSFDPDLSYLETSYGIDSDANDFDRVVTQRYGDPAKDDTGTLRSADLADGAGGIFSYTYFAAIRAGVLGTDTAETDRNGNVDEWSFPVLSGLPVSREACPSSRSELTNREVRAGERNYTTVFFCRADTEITGILFPEGNEIHFEFEPDNRPAPMLGNGLSRGNMIRKFQFPDADRPATSRGSSLPTTSPRTIPELPLSTISRALRLERIIIWSSKSFLPDKVVSNLIFQTLISLIPSTSTIEAT